MIRRMDPLALLAIAMLMPSGIWGLWEGGASAAVLGLPSIGTLVLLMYLAGPAAFVAVTRTHVVVGNPLVRYSVPRSLVDGVRGIDGLSIELRVAGHSPIPIAALIPGVGGHNRLTPGGYRRRFNEITALLDETPATLSAGTVVRRYRYAHLFLLAVDVLALAGMVLYISTDPFTSA
ncbi:hypothetical protein ONA91_29640 [Micromonospora sp. DR5-3]|uniref:hypothetical protein n=1 Tax=unclassified Micromonospora TaxID=2617518 RepID=UPI0011D58F79|nr:MULTISPECIES: hypothetical protein [unclassified Micromonospora]MCW3818609.1 hypothetical protein [Micromonospora sp. DR5-3]TYC20063.1 hypothetical protein FXF52_33410 [Micromonospora sp. MP36]